jgi:hypothetical protein
MLKPWKTYMDIMHFNKEQKMRGTLRSLVPKPLFTASKKLPGDW